LSSFEERGCPAPPPPPNCPTQKPIAENLCTSGSPYCCSGTGSGQVCGPAASTTCTATTICCINTNGVSWKRWNALSSPFLYTLCPYKIVKCSKVKWRILMLMTVFLDANLCRRDRFHRTSND
jgi:hypothetical protein